MGLKIWDPAEDLIYLFCHHHLIRGFQYTELAGQFPRQLFNTRRALLLIHH